MIESQKWITVVVERTKVDEPDLEQIRLLRDQFGQDFGVEAKLLDSEDYPDLVFSVDNRLIQEPSWLIYVGAPVDTPQEAVTPCRDLPNAIQCDAAQPVP